MANIGQSVVPDLSPGLNAIQGIFGTPGSRAATAQGLATQQQISGLTEQIANDPNDEAALLRLARLDPKLSAEFRNVLKRGDERELRVASEQVEQGTRLALRVRGAPSENDKRELIVNEAHRIAGTGGDPTRVLELMNMNPARRSVEIDKMIAQGSDLKTLLKNHNERQASFIPVTDDQGAIVAQQNTLTGEVKTDPRATQRTQPTTTIGKARQDLRDGFITKSEFNQINKAPTPDFKTSTGKLIGDRALARQMFGDNSEQVQAIDAAIKSEAKGKAGLSDVAGVRKEFAKLSGDFIKLRDAIGKVEQSSLNPSPAGDLALIFNFMKIQDPGSVVRESEFATAQNATSLPGRLGAAAQRVVNGERMLPEQRQDFVDTANRLFESQKGKQLELETSFRTIAERQGMNADNVVIDFVGDFRTNDPATLSDSDLLDGL